MNGLSSATFSKQKLNSDLPPRRFNTAALQIWLNHHVYHSMTGMCLLHMMSQVDTLTPYTYCPVAINTTMNITDVECIYINGCTDSYTRWSYLVSNCSTILVHEVQEWIAQNKGIVFWSLRHEQKNCLKIKVVCWNVFTCLKTNSPIQTAYISCCVKLFSLSHMYRHFS